MLSRTFSTACLNQCNSLLSGCILPEFIEGNERPLEEIDFCEVKDKFESLAKQILDLLETDHPEAEESEASPSEPEEFLILFLIHFGEHSKESYWTSYRTYSNCDSSFNLVFGSFSGESCLCTLTKDHGKFLNKLLNKLRPCLLTTTWKMYPTAVRCYMWLLHLLRAPYIGEYLDNLLPTSLIIVDDFTISNKLLGIECLHHIVNNVTLNELRLRSHHEVIFKALESCLLEKDAKLIPILVPCLVTLLTKMYILSFDHYGKWSHYDEILTKYLYKLKLEGDIHIRLALIESLPALMSSSGLITVRYIGNIVEIVDESIINYMTVIPALKVMLELLSTCCVFIDHHLKQLAFIVIKVLYSSKSYRQLPQSELTDSCKQVLIFIHSLNSKLLQELTEAKQFKNLNVDIQTIILEVVKCAR